MVNIIRTVIIQPEFARLPRFFIPIILTNHHRVLDRNKKNAVNEKTQAVQVDKLAA